MWILVGNEGIRWGPPTVGDSGGGGWWGEVGGARGVGGRDSGAARRRIHREDNLSTGFHTYGKCFAVRSAVVYSYRHSTPLRAELRRLWKRARRTQQQFDGSDSPMHRCSRRK